MNKNVTLFNAALALTNAAQIIKSLDQEYAMKLLDKAEEYKDQVQVDPELDLEVENYEKEIKKGL
jgi:hypothetical protein